MYVDYCGWMIILLQNTSCAGMTLNNYSKREREQFD